MKFLVLTSLFLISVLSHSHAQRLKDKLQGSWVCTKIVDADGKPATGKFGESTDYLKFTFRKQNLAIPEAPFDRGFERGIVIDSNFIDQFPGAVIDFPERIYTVKKLNESELILATTNDKKEPFEYHFVNEKQLRSRQLTDTTIDNGIIVIQHFKSKMGRNRVAEYAITNENLHVSPIYDDNISSGFGSYVTSHFEFPKNYPLEKLSSELIIDFNVDQNGADNIKVVEGIDKEIDASIVRLIEKTKNKWFPLKENGTAIKSVLRLRFVFYFEKYELKFPIKR